MKTSSLIAAIVLTAVVVGAGTYYLQDQCVQQLTSEMAALNDEVMQMKDAVPAETPAMEEPAKEEEETTSGSDLEELLPVVIFTPSGLFDDAMKQELQEKVIDPYFDYHNSDEIDFVAMQIELISEAESPSGYMYTVEAMSKNGIYHGFLHGTYGEESLPYYVPECMGSCPFTDEYKEKYPHVVADE